MTEPLARLRGFLRELKRRNVYRVAVAYLAVAFVALQAVNLLVPSTTLPAWASKETSGAAYGRHASHPSDDSQAWKKRLAFSNADMGFPL